MMNSYDRSLCGDGCSMPDHSGRPVQIYNPCASSNHQYFSTSLFSRPAMGALGTSGRAFFHGPGLNNWDMALHKTTRLTERTFAASGTLEVQLHSELILCEFWIQPRLCPALIKALKHCAAAAVGNCRRLEQQPRRSRSATSSIRVEAQ